MQPVKKDTSSWLPPVEGAPFFKKDPQPVANGDSRVCYPIVLFVSVVTAVTIVLGAMTPNSCATQTCSQTADVYGTCVFQADDVTNATKWWFEHIDPYIPDEQRKFYTEPFGGAALVSFFDPDIRQTWVDNTNEAGIRWQATRGSRAVGTRSPIHMHNYGAVSTVLSGFATFFIEGQAPQTFPPKSAFYHPTAGKRMTIAILARPEIDGELKVQATNHTDCMTMYNAPASKRPVIMLENDGFDWRSNLSAPFWRCPDNPPTFVGQPNCETPWKGQGSSYSKYLN